MNQLIKNSFIFFSAGTASIGTYPYAKNFANNIFFTAQSILFATIFFVSAAIIANVALGIFSMMDTLSSYRRTTLKQFIIIYTIALLSALSSGFMCFVGYYKTLPFQLNLIVSAMVTLVNAAISFSAVYNASNYFFTRRIGGETPKLMKQFLIIFMMLGAFISSFVFYLATVNGFASIMHYFDNFSPYKFTIISLVSLLVWLPSASLFINATRITVSDFYERFSKKNIRFSVSGFIILITALLSGSAYAQMALEFFNTSRQIPEFFRQIAAHHFLVFYFITPTAFIISGLVNAYALSQVYKQMA